MKKFHRVIKFNQKDRLKPYIVMNTELRQKTKNKVEKYFFQLMNNVVSVKTTENVRKYIDIKLVTMEKRRNYSVSGGRCRYICIYMDIIYTVIYGCR